MVGTVFVPLLLLVITLAEASHFFDLASRDVLRGVPEDLRVLSAAPRMLRIADRATFEAKYFSSQPVLGMHEMRRLDEAALEVPLPSGGHVSVSLHEYSMLEEPMANVRTFMLRSDDDPTLRGSLTWAEGAIYVSLQGESVADGMRINFEPLRMHHPDLERDDPSTYVSYVKNRYPRIPGSFRCEHGDHKGAESGMLDRAASSISAAAGAFLPASTARSLVTITTSSFGSVRRVNRLALAATAQYGTAVTGLAPTSPNFVTSTAAAMVTAMNRVNEVTLSDFALTMSIITNNNALISTSNTDALSSNDNDASGLISATPVWISNTFSASAYDIGHCFSTGGGGLAGLGVACGSTSNKAQGITGSTNPVGDAYYIDYVAHEMGHQYGGDHTFNSVTGNCGGGNREASAAVEPGSGVTIMAYAGICGVDDVAPNSIAAYSFYSLAQMTATIDTCTNSETANAGGVTISDISADFSVPKSTGFVLDAKATSPSGSLTYSWEESDLGTAASLAAGDLGDNPLFRDYLPTSSASRYVMPGSAAGMIAPTTTRTMYFRVVGRDNLATGGHWSISSPVAVTVANVAAFAISAPADNSPVTAGSAVSTSWSTAASSISSTLCVYLVESGGSADGTCVGTVSTSDGTASITIPASVKNGNTILRLIGTAPNRFFSQVSLMVSGGSGSGLTSNCPASCMPAFQASAAASPASTVDLPFIY